MKYLLLIILILGLGAFISKLETANQELRAELDSTKVQLEEAQKMAQPQSAQGRPITAVKPSVVPAARPASSWLWDPTHKSVLDKK